MENNDILRRLRYAFDFNDKQMIGLFEEGGVSTDRAQVSNWLKRDDDPDFVELKDVELAAYLNGLIVLKRGKKEGVTYQPEQKLNNNIILRKLRIALNFKDEDMLGILRKVDFKLGKHELSAFFRKPEQAQYRLCKDQVMRNFLYGLEKQLRKKA
ncbi:DUF1456 family protein [Persicobacter sp. CCB-QB2]|uniref:DUF1456 family protein n=1 Tax=Persicobacter sp. CCB-QB2 TaxID=1561025 RepID=UPI0006A9F4B0|nr:DUF1456 family protein [Persicobacter sp. CCB-QB2]